MDKVDFYGELICDMKKNLHSEKYVVVHFMDLHSNLNPDLTFSLYAFYVSFFTFPEFVEFQTEKCNALLILKWHQKTL